MSASSEEATNATLGLFQAMVDRLAEGLKARVESPVEVTPVQEVTVVHGAAATQFAAGALLARTAWTADGAEKSGCFLWTGNVGGLLGGDDKQPGELDDVDREALDQSLRLNVEEGGEGDLPLEWTTIESLAAEGVSECLRECGIADPAQGSSYTIRIGEIELGFVFFSAPAGDEQAREVDPGQAPTGGLSTPERTTGPEELPAPTELSDLLDLPIALTIRLGSTRMSLEDILRLIPGSVVELDQREDAPLEVLANGRVVARGEVVVLDDHFGLRVTEIVRGEERLAASH